MEALEILLNSFKKKLIADEIWHEVFSNKDFQKWIIEVLIQDEQLQKGLDATGGFVTDTEGNDSYSYMTEIISNGRKQEGDPYTLKDSGKFYESMLILLGNDFFEIDADPIKDDGTNLFAKYTEEIIGLTEESLEKLKSETEIRYRKVIESLLHVD